MTTDDFTTAARARASSRPIPIPVTAADARTFNEAMVDMAVWARDHLAAQEPSQEEIEAAACEIYGDDPTWGYVAVFAHGEQALDWEELPPDVREMFHQFALRALAAARAVRQEKR